MLNLKLKIDKKNAANKLKLARDANMLSNYLSQCFNDYLKLFIKRLLFLARSVSPDISRHHLVFSFGLFSSQLLTTSFQFRVPFSKHWTW